LALLLYTLTAGAILAVVSRRVTPISRWSALALYALPFAFTGYALVANRVYGPVDLPYLAPPLNWMKAQYGIDRLHNGFLSDVYCQMIPWRKAVQWSFAQGDWPLWNPFILSGDILAAAGQPAVYSPFTLLACLLPVAASLTFTAAITHFLAALGAFLFARELGCRDGAALVASAGFTFSTCLALFILWPLGASWAWLPFVLLAVKRESIPLLTTSLTLLLLSGHPETALHIVFIGTVYAFFEMRGFRARTVGKALIGGILALLLCAIYVIPILEAAPQTMEHSFRTNVFAKQARGVESRQVLARLATDVLPYAHARGWALDPPFHLPPDSAAVGSIILALAIFAAVRVRSAHTWFFAGMAVFCLLARAEWKPLARALQQLPLFDVALNERFSFGAAFALSILAALGANVLTRSTARTFAFVFAAITLGNLWITRTPILTRNDPGWGDYKVVAEIGCLALATVLVLWKPRALAIAALIVVQRVSSDGGLYHSFDPKVAYPPIPILEPTKRVTEPFRITGHGLSFVPGTNALYELEDIRGYEAMTFQPYVDTYPLFATHQAVWFNRVDDLERPFLDFLNVRFAITWDREPPRAGWTEVARQKGSVLLENSQVIGRAFVPRLVRLGVTEPDTMKEMEQQTDFRERAWIRTETLPRHERANGPGRVTSIRWRKLGYDVVAEMDAPGWVVTSIPAWKGWRAFIDGKSAETQIANFAFVSVYVPQGRHRVRLTYLPGGFVLGRAITVCTAIAIALYFIAASFFSRAAMRRSLR
jgi:Bacterial membrane protein YfhO